MNTIYRTKGGIIELTYKNGFLVKIEMSSKGIRKDICYCLDLDIIDEIKLDKKIFKPVKLTTVSSKIKLFNEAFKAWTLKETNEEISYKTSQIEAGMIKTVPVNEDLLRAYFLNDYWTKNKTIANYVKHINEIRTKSATAKSTGSVHSGNDSLEAEFQRRYGNKDSNS